MTNVTEYHFGMVLKGHNNDNVTLPYNPTVEVMLTTCYAECLSRSCVSFDAVFDKKICYFATTPLTANDTVIAPDADAAVFFVSA